MIIDMHMHEMRYSGDSFLRLENMVEIAKRRYKGDYSGNVENKGDSM